MITEIRHIGLVVNNLEQALSFWCEVLGFCLVRRLDESGPHIDAMMGLSGVQLTTVKLAASDGSMIELLYFHSHPDKPEWSGAPYSTGFTHVALTVRNMNETMSRLSEVGVRFPNLPQLSPDGKVRVIYATGPENILLELVEELS